MIEPLIVELVVACSAAHAFDTWTTRTSMWWPHDHTVTGGTGVEITIEPRTGGRIFERAPDGTEHTWGTVTVWGPPQHLGYQRHLGQGAALPTDVLVTFEALTEHECRVVIHHDGWQRLGTGAEQGRQADRAGWDAVLPRFVSAATA